MREKKFFFFKQMIKKYVTNNSFIFIDKTTTDLHFVFSIRCRLNAVLFVLGLARLAARVHGLIHVHRKMSAKDGITRVSCDHLEENPISKKVNV